MTEGVVGSPSPEAAPGAITEAEAVQQLKLCGGGVGRLRARVLAAANRARSLPGAPWAKIDREVTTSLAQAARHENPVATAVALLTIEAKLNSASYTRDEQAIDELERMHAAGAAARPVAGFNPGALIGRLALRGIALRVDATDGSLLAAPAALLNETDRAQLRDHRDSIVASLREERF